MSEFIEARCPVCRSVKDPSLPLCGPCAINTKLEREAKLKARLDAMSVPTLTLIVGILLILKFLPTLGCLGMMGMYLFGGQRDLAAIWLVLAALSLRK